MSTRGTVAASMIATLCRRLAACCATAPRADRGVAELMVIQVSGDSPAIRRGVWKAAAAGPVNAFDARNANAAGHGMPSKPASTPRTGTRSEMRGASRRSRCPNRRATN